jgi:16S rRNA (cytosine967-C5)-methyltransferase
MKMHRLLAEAAAETIKLVFKEHRVLDHALAEAFENHPKWGKRDRGFIAETAFEVVRWRRALGFVADSEETDAMCAAQWRRMGYEIPEWWKFKGASPEEMAVRELQLVDQPRAIRESIPDWLDALGEAELGNAWSDEIGALNQRAPVYLRVNTLKTSRGEAIKWLASHGIEATAVDVLPDALVLARGKSLPKPLRLDGRVEIQDAGSQMIAPMLEAQPGERLIDACSGAGGKALHLAALMRNEGRVFGMDVDAKKLSELERRAKRAGATCIKGKEIVENTPVDFADVADRLLIDAPCSGLGTLRRQPDLKWRLKPAQLERVRSIQKELLATYPAMLKPGGRLVYATCSVLPSENRAAVDALLAGGEFELVDERVISPARDGFDGFYAAALIKR